MFRSNKWEIRKSNRYLHSLYLCVSAVYFDGSTYNLNCVIKKAVCVLQQFQSTANDMA
jgi:hypothetical protein